MTLNEILKSQGLSDEQVGKIVGEMKQNKIFTAGEENLDVRYNKLKTEHDALVSKDGESQKLIAELQKATQGQQDTQAKIAEYEATIQKQQEELEHTKVQAALKVALLGAKATDVDYLAYKLRENGEDIKLDKDGNIKGINDMITDLKTQFPGQFEKAAQKTYTQAKLPEQDGGQKVTKEDFAKMGYASRLKIYNENKELYDELAAK